jgi:hypothetical protein
MDALKKKFTEIPPFRIFWENVLAAENGISAILAAATIFQGQQRTLRASHIGRKHIQS